MEVSNASWLVIALAIVAANLPFLSDKLFMLIDLKARPGDRLRRKPVFVRLLELAALYVLVGLVGFGLEAQIGTRFPQTWEFFAITACLFLVLAFPGFVIRYLRKQH